MCLIDLCQKLTKNDCVHLRVRLNRSQIELYEVLTTSGQLTWEYIAFLRVLIVV